MNNDPKLTGKALKRAKQAKKHAKKHAKIAKKHAALSGGLIQVSARSGRVTGHRRDRWSNTGWSPLDQSGDDMILADVPDVRGKIRDLSLTNPLACSINQKKGLHTIGVGLEMRPSIGRALLESRLGISKEQADDWEAQTAEEFRLWADNPTCSWNHDADFGATMRLYYDTYQRDGDAFALLASSDKGSTPYRLAIQLIDPGRCENPKHFQDGEKDGKVYCAGIEKTLSGRRVAAHFARYHSEGMNRRRRNQVWNRRRFFTQGGRPSLLMMFDQEFPDQSRGLSLQARVIEILSQMGILITEEVNAAVRAGLFVAMLSWDPELVDEDANIEASKRKGSTELESKLYPLDPGEVPHFPAPGRPNEALADFFEFIATLICSCSAIPYSVAMDRFQDSFTASQANMTMFWIAVQHGRRRVVRTYCNPIYSVWLEESVAIGRTDAPGFFDDPLIRMAWSGTVWHGTEKPLIREDIAVSTSVESVQSGLNSLTSVRRQLYGRDSKAIDAERQQDGSKSLTEAAQGQTPGGFGDSTI